MAQKEKYPFYKHILHPVQEIPELPNGSNWNNSGDCSFNKKNTVFFVLSISSSALMVTTLRMRQNLTYLQVGKAEKNAPAFPPFQI
jgi:hypothetical protein